MKTIVALSTPPTNCAVHIIRVSGDLTYEIVQKICDQKITKKGYTIQRVNIIDKKEKIDNVIICKFIAPKSFTGEDVIEINCHGGFFVAQKIIDLLIKNGCKSAGNGEFSQRAFLNNKISLLQARAINNLIFATNEIALKAANIGLEKKTKKELIDIRNKIFKIAGQVEVNIDYPEYDDIPEVKTKDIKTICSQVTKKLNEIVVNSKAILPYREGVNVAIIGKPNSGKSSLLNCFVKEEKAIVSDIPGTTRDVIEARVNVNGITINFLDTAGIRSSKNKIEKIGVEKTHQVIKKSDLVIYVVDNSKTMTKDEKEFINAIKQNKIVVKNKIDLPSKNNIYGVEICARKNKISKLIDALTFSLKTNVNLRTGILLQSTQEINQIESVVSNLKKVEQMIKNKEPLDLTVNHLHEAIDGINNIVGENKDYNFIDELFKSFCVGK